MNVLQRLFADLEFAPRAHILAVPFEHVGVRPAGASHSIYEELWHTVDWQNFVLLMAQRKAVRSDYKGESFPELRAPEDEGAWKALVEEFLTGSEKAVSLAGDAEALETRLADGFSVRERLELLAVHNAYHLGKIVALRQLLGVWNPPRAGVGEAGE